MQLAHITPSDPLGIVLREIIETYHPATILDIGSSDGTGSVATLVLHSQHYEPIINCLEMDSDRCRALTDRYMHLHNVRTYHLPSVGAECVLGAKSVEYYHSRYPDWDCWRSMGLQAMIDWANQTVTAINKFDRPEGIRKIQKDLEIEGKKINMALIDGGEFTGQCELERLYGTEIIVLDDVKGMKNIENYKTLNADPKYHCIAENMNYRNGFAAYEIQH